MPEKSSRTSQRKAPRKGNIHSSPWFWSFLRRSLGSWLRRQYRVQPRHRHILYSMKPPYLLVGNHVTFWDPFIISAYTPHRVFWVASDAAVRVPWIRRFLTHHIGIIPKSKMIPDFTTIKEMMILRDRGCVMGLFPEGQTNWDGRSLDFIESTGKLIKLLKIPVISVRQEGGFTARPRFAVRRRRGDGISLTFEQALSAGDVRRKSPAEIMDALRQKLTHNEWETPVERAPSHDLNHLAEYLERSLFLCPSCGRMSTLFSRRNRLSCRSCGYSVRLNSQSRFLPPDHPGKAEYQIPRFSTIAEWNDWQQAELLRRWRPESRGTGSKGAVPDEYDADTPITSDDDIRLLTGFRTRPLLPRGRGQLLLFPDRIEWHSSSRTTALPLSGIYGLNVQNNERLELYWGKSLYRFRSRDNRFSAYKYLSLITILKEGRIFGHSG